MVAVNRPGRLPLQLGKPAESLRAGIASVPQELTVAPTLTVAQNVMLGHEPSGPLGRLRERTLRREAAEVLELSHRALLYKIKDYKITDL